ncbi:YaiI/YqxD family protein [Paenibacillus sp. GCM10023252]|uniref:YaiI/YqxD family protein n=1 Tax=Paenibacillus sp. GCM10023252 TaxID=3252649 RepID=UPI0036092044
MQRSARTIVVDGDACPVKTEIAETARAFSIPVLMVSSYDHKLQPSDGVKVIQVDRSSQSVDLYIVNHVAKGDIVVTQDFGLACIAMAKGALVLSPRGEQYDEGNIDFLMERRHEAAKKRRSGGRTRGPKPMTNEDRERFQQKLTKVLQSEQEKDCT